MPNCRGIGIALISFMKNLFLIILLLSSFSQAQDFPLEQQSGLMTIRIVPGDKTIKVFVVGYEKAKVKWDDLALEASTNIGGKERILKIVREDDHFNIERSSKDLMKLELKIKGLEKTSVLKFDVP